ncbi:MAG: alginate export family protein [Proteobacteria bacterium]|nr:alginate export family protein [Pseudomonadota bacterium]
MHIKTYLRLLSLVSGLVLMVPCYAAEPTPLRLREAVNAPAWLNLSGTHRTRYETLDSQFRAGLNGGDQQLVMRTTVMGALHQGPFTVAAELLDARAALDDRGTLINTGMVNTAELLQAYFQWQAADVFTSGAKSDLRAGRVTMDIGSRRFVARNRFRNTMNAFTGIDWQWASASGRTVRAFYTLPVNRQPTLAAELRNNEAKFDEEKSDVSFWGLFLSEPMSWGDVAELYYFGLDEDDASDLQTRDRQLSTVGFRLFRNAEVSKFDYQIESTVQFGESRTSTAATDVADLDHFAHFQHVEIGYTFDHPTRVRLIAQYDYASGDDTPNDGDNERFDTLFGARRFDFGPTGIYGAFERANINTPGLRLELKPHSRVTCFVAHRGYWLASDSDAWTTSGVRDVTGKTGQFIGQQIEASVQWNILPGNVALESGVTHLFAGEFMDDAPNANRQGDATYFYSQIGFTF